ncbi:hypothetical protein DPMN_027352 [Dreissena polymorpha]|uniref:Uncharacterized protein n=1 Tax=Dreissena polymorpha TaxID=45954 RepID=A0A9D4LSU8_DREPO|nr:hypothetical protein DPMN_027352 [Dreissena polymorpha]
MRFMGGPKNETHFLCGNQQLSPADSKINFACPSEKVLLNYNPVHCDLSGGLDHGIIDRMITLVANNTNESLSYVIMFDGKKIKRGTDIDLIGFESEPLVEKKLKFEAEKNAVDEVVQRAQSIIKCLESDCDVELETRNELNTGIHKCFHLYSNTLLELKQLKKSKELAVHKYKDKIKKDPKLAKAFEFAIDSCRTFLYQIDNCVSGLLSVQWELCKSGSYLNGAFDLFAKNKNEVVLTKQSNVKLFDESIDEQSEDLPTHTVKQRTDKWFDARSKMKVTGSSIYTAIGLDGLKRLHGHFDNVFSNVPNQPFSEQQENAMRHGTESEKHEIATLSSIVLPFLFPNLIYFEEGYYVENNVMVSPDGCLRDAASMTAVYAFEGKAPFGSIWCRQHYKVPERYMTQTIFEQKVLSAENGTLYLCWTPESTTVFRVPVNRSLHSKCMDIIDSIYMKSVPKRPTRIPKEIKSLRQEIKEHVEHCEFLGEFPSVKACEINRDYLAEPFSYHDLMRALMKGKQLMKEVYNLKRHFASQVVVYLLADLDRLWKPELPHAVPIMYCYRGPSMTMEIARNLLEHVVKACTNKGLHIAAVSSDGEFVQLMVKDKKGQPLTLHQLSKNVWNDVSKMKKQELINRLKALNKTHTF